MALLHFISLILVVLLMKHSVSCLDPPTVVDSTKDIYDVMVDRDIILTLVKRIDNMEAWNRKLENTNMKQQKDINQLKATVQHQKRKLGTIERILKQRNQDEMDTQKSLESSSTLNGQNSQHASTQIHKVKQSLKTRASSTNIIIQKDDQLIVDSNDGRRQFTRQIEAGYRVAFFATASDHLLNQGVGQILEFRNASTNIGNGYNLNTGTFTAPYSGTYVFSVSLMGHDTSESHYFIAKNNGLVSNLYIPGTDSPYTTTSHTVVLQLKQGDDVEIRNRDVGKGVYGSHYSCFSGFLLYYGDSSDIVVG